ncbi:hypothetical protein JI76_36560 [Streptomyces anulatus]|nr:hypothetical protein JI76_36560 [Streptomyces anulatus]KQX30439.1 hypothetical protein ASD29_16395 [Streptomyces sp. Root1295]KRA40370.1 hypothetical protein ASD97_11215 [Streptomyces sp. Root63]
MVPDEQGLGRECLELFQCAGEESWARFAAGAADGGWVRAVQDDRTWHADGREIRDHAVVDAVKLVCGEQAAADGRLVGDDGQVQAKASEPGAGVEGAGQPSPLFGAGHVVGSVDVEDAVAVEEDDS